MWYTESAYNEGDIEVEDMLGALRAQRWQAADDEQQDNVSWWAT